jgi:Dyp-type peroxidase family
MGTYTVDLDQIQGNVTPGFRKDHQDFLFFKLPQETFDTPPDRAAARAWLRALQSSIATARDVATFNALFLKLKARIAAAGGTESPERYLRSTWVNVAFTHIGHAALYTGALGTNAQQSTAFRLGMFNRKDQTRDYLPELADSTVRDSVRTDWSSYLNPPTPTHEASQVAHLVVIIGADSEAELDAERADQIALATSHGLILVEQYSGVSLGGGREHFGFKDGISQPDPNNLLDPAGWVTSEQVAAPGEFIRGAGAEPTNTGIRAVLPWETNGSYMVLRRLDQNVHEFRAQGVAGAAALPGAPGMSPALFEAKCIGRWPDGTPLSGTPLIDAATYSGDPDGTQIPRFSHIRKAYPRDQATAKPQHHRLIRRGITFGPAYPSLPAGAPANTEERGLIFVAYMASIEQQFEFLMHKWFGDQAFADTPPRPIPGFDPIMGCPQNQPAASRSVNYPVPAGAAITYQTLSIARYIKLKGGGYFFSPSIAHLATLATP